MNPSARLQAAIDLLDKITAAARDQGASADTIVARWFAERRYAGSKDRRAIRELVYDAIRMLGERPASGRAAMLALAQRRPELAEGFDGSSYGPAPIAPDEPVAQAGLLPAWLARAFEASDLGEDEQAALLARAPLDIRVNPLKADPDAIAATLPGAMPLEWLPAGLRLASDTPVEQLPAYKDGQFEVQDAGSQLVSLAAGAEPGQRVIDLCAGGGGKTLALAAAMANQGVILACDVDRPRLSRLMPRAERAGVTIAGTRLLNPGREPEMLADQLDRADLVLVDAPCSGTGTWRRNPEARWRLTPERLARYVATQAALLDIAAGLVRPGGALVHIVCSLLDAEGAGQAEAFLARHPGWTAAPLAMGPGTPRGPGLRLTPLRDSTDGFFVAKMTRP
ncbi:16S rRNA (cytosine967-C5)-methyltransferase [Sphingomonas naasensis]|uniref:RsmB/NOP family class I SAM-dependent RNA methyltransferase n=1 Tax=Sphingomonas naasensis TaxID=1344951 RepID=A0A4S1WP29_9SPHN|nr:RsmB/NOP family class I SAM-dependent RNA methyltransferase [Sphingomonas naasensis]NIJ20133.1 16S rRNA (cytosine967-C5)-methyltransferase [Sphingomonas naasensis]TGX44285.1 RsmB/NOP family class I SAM-dependent RNA methyltransferase [Sphingomonas naasensis]